MWGGGEKTHTRCTLQVLYESLRRRNMKWRERARVRFCWFLARATLIIEGETQAWCLLLPLCLFFFPSLFLLLSDTNMRQHTLMHLAHRQVWAGEEQLWRHRWHHSSEKLSELLTESQCEHAATVSVSYTYTGAVFIMHPRTPGFHSLVHTIFYSLWRVGTSADLYTSVHQQEIRVMSTAKRWHVYIFNPLRLLFFRLKGKRLQQLFTRWSKVTCSA